MAPVTGPGRVRGRRHVHDTVTVLVSYGATLLAAKLANRPAMEWEGGAPSPGASLLVIGIFTATHAVGASFIYAMFLGLGRRVASGARPGGTAPGLIKAGGCFVSCHMAFWYGGPTVFLVIISWTPAPLLALAHVAASPRGTRLWRAIAYGSAFFAVLLLVIATQGLRVGTPLWVVAAAVGYQMVLLRLQGRFASRFFLSPADPSPQKG